MRNRELEIYKGFFDRVENIIKDDKKVSDEEKLAIIFIELENMIRYQYGGVSNEVHDFIQKLRNNNETLDRPLKKDRYLTNKEFAMWLAKGNGQSINKRTGIISCNYSYITNDNIEIDHNFMVRRWEDEEWYEPTYDYCFVGIRR